MSVLTNCAFIPVRAGSKRIRNKNLKLLNGKPLLTYIINAALNSCCFENDNICVISDDSRALDVAIEMGVQAIEIPTTMADDHSPILPVLQTACESKTGTAADLICYLRATSPFVSPSTIQNAIKLLIESQSPIDSVVSVQAVTGAHPSRFKQLDINSGLLVNAFPEYKEGLQPVSSSSLNALQRNNAVTAMWRDTLMKKNSLWGERIRPMVMNNEMESLDINTPFEFAFADGEYVREENQKIIYFTTFYILML